ncbi:hypothetical protein G6011_05009 [Alternaria panax]|uniref:Uncharacterized protein n=1 Tax=Alternaria panax TaxID=48097 RepID=A0AAD4I651_9PLEO|nr:hypothetical protein G6011_05009 [Alternaria panax]
MSPYSEAASLEYYSSKSLKELKVLAKIHGFSDAAEPQEIVTLLMKKDKARGVWPGMFDDPDAKDRKGPGVALAKQVSKETEIPSGTKIIAGEESKNASSTAAVSNEKTATSPKATMAATGSNKDVAIPMAELRKEWDGQWGPPFAFPKAVTVASESQGTSVATARSTPTQSKPSASPTSLASPVSLVSPVSPASSISPVFSPSSKSNRYGLLASEEKEIIEPEEKVIEVIDDEISATNKDTEKVVEEECVTAPIISQEAYEEHVQIFSIAPPLPKPSIQTAPASTPTKTKSQSRNEKRKENKQAASSNMYNLLVPDEPADASTLDSSDTKEHNDGDSGECAAPAAKKKKRGTKGGKKTQTQKKKHTVPVVETTTPIIEAVTAPIVRVAVAAKVQPIHLAFGAVVMILAGALGTWAIV